MRTLLLMAALFAFGCTLSAPPPPIQDPELTLTAGRGGDGGKKKKDEEKEEDYALRMNVRASAIS